ncbi:MAG: FAD:protein FMN transferase [Bacteriovoracia bacterium]
MKLWILLLTLPLAGCFFSGSSPVPLEYQGNAFGSYYKVKYVSGPTTPGPQALQAETEKLISDYNDELSAWKPDSFISRFNQSKDLVPMSVGPIAMALIQTSETIWKASSGAFDPTVAPLVKLWGFGTKKAPRIPTAAEVQAVRGVVGFEKLKIDPTKMTWQKTHPDMAVDINAVAPGQAADLIGALLEKRGVTSYLVDVGGELLARGERAPGQAWVVGIEKPSLAQGEGLVLAVSLRDASVATSGNYRNFLDTEKGRISHTIDPRTGLQPNHKTVSVTVIAKTALEADAWATVIMVLGPEVLKGDGPVTRQIQQRGLKVFLLEGKDDGTFQEHLNGPMQELLAQPKEQ